MSIVLTLTPELEALLRGRADRQGQDVSLVASELLANVLAWEEQDFEEAVQGIQQGLDDFEAGRFRSFDDFAAEKRRQYGLSTASN
jgi:predicted transcriptional regulator